MTINKYSFEHLLIEPIQLGVGGGNLIDDDSSSQEFLTSTKDY
jgi:hypothetical protein